MSDFEFNVPLPVIKTGIKGADKNGLVNFPIGGSKYYPNANSGGLINQAKQKNKGGTFTTRVETQNGIKGVRIWRLS